MIDHVIDYEKILDLLSEKAKKGDGQIHEAPSFTISCFHCNELDGMVDQDLTADGAREWFESCGWFEAANGWICPSCTKGVVKTTIPKRLLSPDCPIASSPIAYYFELSRASFLTVPRLVMESMPIEWQRDMAELLNQLDETFDWRPSEGRYWVKLRDNSGRFTEAPLADYRHGDCEHLRKVRN